MRSNECYKIEREIVTEFLDQGKDIPEGFIVNYLTKCFPDSCFAHNYEDYNNKFYYDINEELYAYFHFEVLKWCGCGSPEEADKPVVKYLNLVDSDHRLEESRKMCKEYFDCESIYDNPLLLCLAYTMDAAEFTEHGSSIGGAWITDRGRIYRYAIMKHLENEGESLE